MLVPTSVIRWKRKARAGRLRQRNADRAQVATVLDKTAGERSDLDVLLLEEATRDIDFFAKLRAEGDRGRTVASELCKVMRRETWPSHTAVVRQGDEGHSFFIIFSGKCTVHEDPWSAAERVGANSFQAGHGASVSRMRSGTMSESGAFEGADGMREYSNAGIVDRHGHVVDLEATSMMRELLAGDCFGEVALQRNITRSATVVTRAATEFLVIDAENYNAILRDLHANSIAERTEFLKTMAAFKHLATDSRQMMNLQILMTPVKFDSQTIILREGDPPENIYFITDGTCSVSKTCTIADDHLRALTPHQTHQQFQVDLSTLMRSETFGDIAYLTDCKVQPFSIIANCEVRCFVLTKGEFNRGVMHGSYRIFLDSANAKFDHWSARFAEMERLARERVLPFRPSQYNNKFALRNRGIGGALNAQPDGSSPSGGAAPPGGQTDPAALATMAGSTAGSLPGSADAAQTTTAGGSGVRRPRVLPVLPSVVSNLMLAKQGFSPTKGTDASSPRGGPVHALHGSLRQLERYHSTPSSPAATSRATTPRAVGSPSKPSTPRSTRRAMQSQGGPRPELLVEALQSSFGSSIGSVAEDGSIVGGGDADGDTGDVSDVGQLSDFDDPETVQYPMSFNPYADEGGMISGSARALTELHGGNIVNASTTVRSEAAISSRREPDTYVADHFRSLYSRPRTTVIVESGAMTSEQLRDGLLRASVVHHHRSSQGDEAVPTMPQSARVHNATDARRRLAAVRPSTQSKDTRELRRDRADITFYSTFGKVYEKQNQHQVTGATPSIDEQRLNALMEKSSPRMQRMMTRMDGVNRRSVMGQAFSGNASDEEEEEEATPVGLLHRKIGRKDILAAKRAHASPGKRRTKRSGGAKREDAGGAKDGSDAEEGKKKTKTKTGTADKDDPSSFEQREDSEEKQRLDKFLSLLNKTLADSVQSYGENPNPTAKRQTPVTLESVKVAKEQQEANDIQAYVSKRNAEHAAAFVLPPF